MAFPSKETNLAPRPSPWLPWLLEIPNSNAVHGISMKDLADKLGPDPYMNTGPKTTHEQKHPIYMLGQKPKTRGIPEIIACGTLMFIRPFVALHEVQSPATERQAAGRYHHVSQVPAVLLPGLKLVETICKGALGLQIAQIILPLRFWDPKYALLTYLEPKPTKYKSLWLRTSYFQSRPCSP